MQARASEVFVGRVRELRELERTADAVRAGRGGTVLITGEAGIGKTRLVGELARRARRSGFEVLLGGSIDLVGTDLPYQPVVEALRPLGDPWQIDGDGRSPGSQRRLFENTLALINQRAAVAPVLLVLEDLHWADTSTLDLVVFLAHNLGERPILLAVTYRAEDAASDQRMRRFAVAVGRSGPALDLRLGPLDRDELTALLAAHSDGSLPMAVADTIASRSEGNPFFAVELADADGSGDELPVGLRDVLLQRLARLDRPTPGVLRLAAAAGREVRYALLRATVELPERDLRHALRDAVAGGVLVADPATSSFRFRHALLAEAVYATILPGEREDLHARLATELARNAAVTPAELAPHWAAAGRSTEALAASVDAAGQAESVFGLIEARAHLERALALWDEVPDPGQLAGLDLAELCARTAELASQTGQAPRAVELGRRAIELVGADDPLRAASLYRRLGRYLHESGKTDAALSAFERAVALVPAEPPSVDRAEALAALAFGLMLAWRFDESLPICEQALALAHTLGARAVEHQALIDRARDLAYLGRADEGLGLLRRALQLAHDSGDPQALLNAYVSLTDVLMMTGRPGEAAQVASSGLDAARRFGIDSTILVANHIEALLALGDWDEADSRSAEALCAITANFPYMLFILRADLELGRGEFESARSHLEEAGTTLREDRGQGIYDIYLAELALWEHRWTDADQAVRDARSRADSREAAQLRVWFCAKGLRAHAELAALARARRDAAATRDWLTRADGLIDDARHAAAEAAAVTPSAAGWSAMAEAEYARARGVAQPESWSQAAAAWDQIERLPIAAYCRWRQAEALVAAGASRAETREPLRQAHAVALGIGAKPLLREIELLAQRARLDLTAPDVASPDRTQTLAETLGLTAREAEVLTLVARGYTNLEIAQTLVVSDKTISVHVSHILRKLGAPNRREAAAIAHRLSPPPPQHTSAG